MTLGNHGTSADSDPPSYAGGKVHDITTVVNNLCDDPSIDVGDVFCIEKAKAADGTPLFHQVFEQKISGQPGSDVVKSEVGSAGALPSETADIAFADLQYRQGFFSGLLNFLFSLVMLAIPVCGWLVLSSRFVFVRQGEMQCASVNGAPAYFVGPGPWMGCHFVPWNGSFFGRPVKTSENTIVNLNEKIVRAPVGEFRVAVDTEGGQVIFITPGSVWRTTRQSVSLLKDPINPLTLYSNEEDSGRGLMYKPASMNIPDTAYQILYVKPFTQAVCQDTTKKGAAQYKCYEPGFHLIPSTVNVMNAYTRTKYQHHVTRAKGMSTVLTETIGDANKIKVSMVMDLQVTDAVKLYETLGDQRYAINDYAKTTLRNIVSSLDCTNFISQITAPRDGAEPDAATSGPSGGQQAATLASVRRNLSQQFMTQAKQWFEDRGIELLSINFSKTDPDQALIEKAHDLAQRKIDKQGALDMSVLDIQIAQQKVMQAEADASADQKRATVKAETEAKNKGVLAKAEAAAIVAVGDAQATAAAATLSALLGAASEKGIDAATVMQYYTVMQSTAALKATKPTVYMGASDPVHLSQQASAFFNAATTNALSTMAPSSSPPDASPV